MTANDTPRTDVALREIEDNCRADGLTNFPAYTNELVNLSRKLERELAETTKATAARCVEICMDQVSRPESRMVTVTDCADAIKKEYGLE